MILRPGYITQEMLEEVIGEVHVDPGLIASDSLQKPKAPGMKYRHYAPKADLTVVTGEKKDVIGTINYLSCLLYTSIPERRAEIFICREFFIR